MIKRTNQSAPTPLHSQFLARICAALLLTGAFAAPTVVAAETCITQSALAPPDRDRLAQSARTLAAQVQANQASAIRATTTPDLAKDFGALQYLIAVTAPKLAADNITLDQIYLLDATNLKPGASGEAQFYCSLNRSTMEAEFDISGLTAGKYAFALLNFTPPASSSNAPYRLSLLLHEDSTNPAQPTWQLAGLYPRTTTAAGHAGLYYWTQARQFAKDKQPWNAWLDYQAAIRLLQPADFVQSTHLEKLRTEANAATPPALAEGISADTPLVVKSADGTEYHFTSLALDESPSPSALDIVVHLRADPLPDPAAARKRNDSAASALLTAFPELRKPFHGVALYADTPGQNSFSSEQAMTDIH